MLSPVKGSFTVCGSDLHSPLQTFDESDNLLTLHFSPVYSPKTSSLLTVTSIPALSANQHGSRPTIKNPVNVNHTWGKGEMVEWNRFDTVLAIKDHRSCGLVDLEKKGPLFKSIFSGSKNKDEADVDTLKLGPVILVIICI
jgi:hypothetical protein